MAELNVEGFRDLEHIFTPDIRSTCHVRFENGGTRPVTIEDRHHDIDKIEINECVPLNIRNHFENAKNLCLYSWYVYRFGPVAEHQAFVTFEFALRERLKEAIQDPDSPPGFKKLLQIAVKEGLLINEKFTHWHTQKEQIRYQNEQNKQIAVMVGFEFKPLVEEIDYLSILIEAFPNLRNFYAHGTAMLHPVKLDILLTCAEGINQLFSEPETNILKDKSFA